VKIIHLKIDKNYVVFVELLYTFTN